MPKMFMRVKDNKSKEVYYFQWSTITDEPNSEVVNANDFVELHYALESEKYATGDDGWAEQFANDMIQLSKTNVSTPDYTRAVLLACSDNYKTVKSLVEYCRTNLVK